MIGIEALECFIDRWESKIRKFDEVDEFEAFVEYALGNDIRRINTKVKIEKYFDKKIRFEDLIFDDLKTCFLPEDIEYDDMTGNLYIKKNLYKIKIAPKIY